MKNLANQSMKIKRIFASTFLGLALTGVRALTADSIPYSTLQVIAPGDSDAVIAEKAAKVLPRPYQTAYMRLERTFFLHFGVNTFNAVEWGTGRENPSIFNPEPLDANQWLTEMQNFGGKMIVLVCKHHDGFCVWPSRYTTQSVASSPWRGGKGDEVKEVANAARSHGLKFAVYLSPADLYQMRREVGGYYGDGSSNVLSVIPTDPASFKSDPSKGRTPAPGFTNYTYEVDDYNRYFLNQLYELLTEYGPIQEVWFDGANPNPRVRQSYNYAAWYDLIRRLQPNAIIFGKGPDARWVGTESGYGRTTEWSVIPLPRSPENFDWPDMTARDLGSRSKLRPGSYLTWYPAEVNVTILEGGAWFWASQKHPRTLTQLYDIFFSSVGRNGNLILNLSPDNRGLIPDDQVETLRQLSTVVNATFSSNLATGAKLAADTANPTNGAQLALDGNLDTWWEAAQGKTNGEVTLTLPKAITFDVVSLQEAVDHRSQRIESFAIDTWNGSDWAVAEKISSDELTTVGYHRLIRLKSPATTDKVRIRVTGSRLEPTLADVALYKQASAALPPSISDRDSKGLVTLNNSANCKMVYTTDGTAPTLQSSVYSSPVAMLSGGTLRAACLMPSGQLGIVATKNFAGVVPIGWKVVSADNQDVSPASNAIDGERRTLWQTSTNSPLPQSLTVDMGAERRIAGFTYLPRQDRSRDGIVDTYRFETSTDGKTWTTNIASGRFGNIRNSPTLQEVPFAPVNARFFRFTALQEINNKACASAAEISVLSAQ
jgi:alpha-L-fucosidase